MPKPNYHDGSIVNLMSSLTLGLGGAPGPYRPLPLLLPQTVAEADHLVLWVIDGLGHHYLQRHGDLVTRRGAAGQAGINAPGAQRPAPGRCRIL